MRILNLERTVAATRAYYRGLLAGVAGTLTFGVTVAAAAAAIFGPIKLQQPAPPEPTLAQAPETVAVAQTAEQDAGDEEDVVAVRPVAVTAPLVISRRDDPPPEGDPVVDKSFTIGGTDSHPENAGTMWQGVFTLLEGSIASDRLERLWPYLCTVITGHEPNRGKTIHPTRTVTTTFDVPRDLVQRAERLAKRGRRTIRKECLK